MEEKELETGKSPNENAAPGNESNVLPQFGLAEEILGKSSEEEKVSKPAGWNGSGMDEMLMKFVTFFLGNEEYALPISQVQEINRVGEITRVPNSPDHVMGVINLRGKIVPVIELKHRLKLGQTKIGKESRVVVVENGPKVMGLMVDRVSQVLNMAAEQIDEAPEEVVQVDENYIKGVGKMDERMIIMLDLQAIVGNGMRS